MNIEPKEVSPRKVLAQIASALPFEVHPNIIIIGSLAAAYWLFHGDETFGVRHETCNTTFLLAALLVGPPGLEPGTYRL
jgi:hypothetical protein